MKEQLIKYWERREQDIKKYPQYKNEFYSQCYGALDFVRSQITDPQEDAELVVLWNEVWRPRLYALHWL